MEPLTALSLFCNIVDICDHSIKVCKEFTEIYRSVKGRSTRDEELLAYVEELEGILNSVRVSSSRLDRDSSYQAILGPLGRMEAKSAAVKDILDDFRASKPGNRLSAVIATAKVIRGRGKLDRTLQDLKQCRDDVHFAIAQSTRIQLGEIATHSERLSKGQCDIQSELASLDNRLKKLDKGLTELPDIVAKAKKVSEEVHKELCALSVLGRLGNTNQRYWDVTEADSHTFHWILPDQAESGGLAKRDDEQELNSGDDEATPEWKSKARLEYEKTQSDVNRRLRDWLLNGSGLFHISGKPGSGKSTLMKYLVRHPSVRSSLEEWARPKRLALGTFFFWKPDHGQNTLEALIRGLLYSVIHYDSDLVHVAFPKHIKDSYEQLSMRTKLDMTKDEIFEAFRNLTRDSQASKRFNFCFFIDGLDELDEEKDTTHSKIVTTLQQWTDASRDCVKICVSSRHFPVFENMPVDHRIRLQDLTKYDIINFVQNFLRPRHACQSTKVACAEDYKDLADTVVGSADGVFLWVTLVLRSLERGLSNGDSVAVLRERVKNTPKGLDELFKSLFDSIEDCHAQMVILLLDIATVCSLAGNLSLSACRQFFRAKETSKGCRIDDIFQPGNCPESFELTPELVTSTKSKIFFQCKGMLETVPAEQGENFEQYTGGRVTFLHRSIPESLREWLPERMKAQGLCVSHRQNAMCWMLWAEIHFLNSSIDPQQLSRDDQFSLQYYIRQMACDILADLRTDAILKSDLSTPFQLLDLAEDALLPKMSLPEEEERDGKNRHLEGHTWNTKFCDDPLRRRRRRHCYFFPLPLLAAAKSHCYAYVRWRMARASPSPLHNNCFQHCLEAAFEPFTLGSKFDTDQIEDCTNIAAALIQTTGAYINRELLRSNCSCTRFSAYFGDAASLLSLFDTIWMLFLFHPQHSNVDFQKEAFCAIEALLELGALPRSVLCVGKARDWFMLSPSPSTGSDNSQMSYAKQLRGCSFYKFFAGDGAVDGRLRMICGQDDGIVTLEKLAAYAKPRNMAVILSLIERNFRIEDAKLGAVTDLTPSARFQAAELKKHGGRGDEILVWLE